MKGNVREHSTVPVLTVAEIASVVPAFCTSRRKDVPENTQGDGMGSGQKSLIPGETEKCNLLKAQEKGWKHSTYIRFFVLLLPQSFQPSSATTSR